MKHSRWNGDIKMTPKYSETVSPIPVAIAATALWIIAVVWLSYPSFKTLMDDEGFIQLNSMGDFFAGLFAPIAAGWFILAVFLQRQELHDTRAELKRQAVAQENQSSSQTANHIIEAIQTIDLEKCYDAIEDHRNGIQEYFQNISIEHGIGFVRFNDYFDVDCAVAAYRNYIELLDRWEIDSLLIMLHNVESEFRKEFYILQSIVDSSTHKHPLVLSFLTTPSWNMLMDMFNTMQGVHKLVNYHSGSKEELEKWIEKNSQLPEEMAPR